MNNLLRMGLTESLVNEMISKNEYETIENLDFNYDALANILSFFKIIGIKNIRDLLTDYTNIFFLDLEYIQKRFAKNGLNNSVNEINEDLGKIIDILYENEGLHE